MEEKNRLKAVLFDLDGVIVDTARYHYKAWKWLADRENIYFDEIINERLKGVSRMASLEILLEKGDKLYTQQEKEIMCTLKNNYYLEMIETLTPEDVLEGVVDFLKELKSNGIQTAVCSASKSAKYIIDRLELNAYFDWIVDGNDVKRPKPDPEVFEIGYTKLGCRSQESIVVEDAFAGIEAAKVLGIKTVGIGDIKNLSNADLLFKNIKETSLQNIIEKLDFFQEVNA
ncbi:MAG: putative phosphatase/phosphohexomutase [Clostridia bacterium]|jgi:beta-phosphoglucomutase|nr:putative phosphatase/phosphohexomutase [Clostridia bacterium]